MEGEMGRKLKDVMAALPAERRERIKAAAAAELAEMTLGEIRQAVAATQTEMATRLNVAQSKVSEMERRQDHLLSSLRRYVEAAGGQLDVVVSLPDRTPVRLSLDGGPRKG
jgi:DNA-binding transcriptional regulator YiaG